MAWTAPRTWTVGEIVTKALLDTHLRDQLTYLGGPDSRGTSLPVSPVDGQLYVYTADSTNGVEWLLKYESATGKWRYLGGGALYSVVDTAEVIDGTSWRNLATDGPSKVVPLAGVYRVRATVVIQNLGGTGGRGHVGAANGNTSPTGDFTESVVAAGAGVADQGTVYVFERITCAANDTVKLRYGADNTTTALFAAFRRMEVEPERIG